MRNKIPCIFSTCIETCFCNITSLIIIIPKLYLTSRLIPNKLRKTSHNIKNNSSAHLLIFQCTIVCHIPATSLLNGNNQAKIMYLCVLPQTIKIPSNNSSIKQTNINANKRTSHLELYDLLFLISDKIYSPTFEIYILKDTKDTKNCC